MHSRLFLSVLSLAVAVMVVRTATTEAADPPKADGTKQDDKKNEVKAPSFKADVLPIMTASCTGCHNQRKKKAGYDLTTHGTLVKSVQPGMPEKSKLFMSLHGKGAKQMPPKSALADKEIEVIKAWIAAGAKND